MNEIEDRNLAYIELKTTDTKKAAYILSEKLSLANFKIMAEHTIRVYDADISPHEISKALALNDVEITALGRQSETLEDYFLKITGEEAAPC